MAGISTNIRDHGTLVNSGKDRKVQCIYCQNVMQSFYRLKYHLGNIARDVSICNQVPPLVKETFYKIVVKGKTSIPVAKRSRAPKRGRIFEVGSSSSQIVVPTANNNVPAAALSSNQADHQIKCIGRFLYEHCVDFSAVDSISFRDMMAVVGGGQMGFMIVPTSHDLDGPMLQEALKDVNDHVNKVKDTWAITGCSILLDAWVDQRGHDLVTFLADCPAGPVYLKSFNVSDIKDDVTALHSLVNGIIQDVGVENVVQVIGCSSSGWVGELGKHFSGRHSNEVFWSVSVSHCFELMLRKIEKMYDFGDVLSKVDNIREFIKNNHSVLKGFREHSRGFDITASHSEFEFIMPYLTLESILKAKNYLLATFAKSRFVDDSKFWETAERVVTCTSPIVQGLLWFEYARNQHVGYVYDYMEGVKQTISWSYKYERQFYKPICDVIDEIWNNYLRNPLYAAGYFLNPRAFYSRNFRFEPDVTTGLSLSMIHVVKEMHIRVKIATQFEDYRLAKGCFQEASQVDQIYGIYLPAEWWAQKASEHPELQSFAVKVLSQTCEGASRYKLKRNLAEKLLLTEGMSHRQQKHLEELAYVHYNLHLQSCKAKL